MCIERYATQELTLKCCNQSYLGPCASDASIGAPSYILKKRAAKVCCQSGGSSNGPIAFPANGSPSNIETSSRVGAISPHLKWKVWVSGLHRSTKQVSKEESMLRCRDVSVASTRRANGKSPTHLSLHIHQS